MSSDILHDPITAEALAKRIRAIKNQVASIHASMNGIVLDVEDVYSGTELTGARIHVAMLEQMVELLDSEVGWFADVVKRDLRRKPRTGEST